jgi:hypothetical protein
MNKVWVGFTGTRQGMTEKQAEAFEILLKRWLDGHTTIIFTHGDCVGADKDAHELAMKYGDISIEKRPCDLENYRAHCVGGTVVAEPKSPLDRNKDIVNESDILVACPGEYTEQLRSGTWSTLRYAKKQNHLCFTIYPNGTIETFFDGKIIKTDSLPLETCCENENRSMQGGCLNCGDPCL